MSGKVVSDFYDSKILRFHPLNYGDYYTKDLEILNKSTRKATYEEKIKFITKDFPWGEVIIIYQIGEYQIIEGKRGDGKTEFHPYINFKSISQSYDTLDSALIGTIFNKYKCKNNTYFVIKALGIDKELKW